MRLQFPAQVGVGDEAFDAAVFQTYQIFYREKVASRRSPVPATRRRFP